MLKILVSATLALGVLFSSPLRADALHNTNSEASLIVSMVSVLVPVYVSAKASEAFTVSINSMSETKKPIVVTKIEEQDSGYLLEADADGSPLKFKVQGKLLKNADVVVGTKLQVVKTRTAYILEKNNVSVGIITTNPDLLKQQKLN